MQIPTRRRCSSCSASSSSALREDFVEQRFARSLSEEGSESSMDRRFWCSCAAPASMAIRLIAGDVVDPEAGRVLRMTVK
jgi:hypothetical protein